jgi:hypothetical protein
VLCEAGEVALHLLHDPLGNLAHVALEGALLRFDPTKSLFRQLKE